MKKYIIIFILFPFNIFPGYPQERSIILQAKKLDSLYQITVSNKNKSLELYNEFFNTFPDDFTTFDNIYGYAIDIKTDSILYEGILYDKYYEHICVFFSSFDTIVGLNNFVRKLINLSRNSWWDADDVGCLQQIINDKTEKYSEIFFKSLMNLPEKEIKGFWYFYFAGPHPIDQIPEFLTRYKDEFPTVYEELHKSFHEAHKEACPGH